MYPDLEELALRITDIKVTGMWHNDREGTERNFRLLELEVALSQAISLAEISATLQVLATSGSVPPVPVQGPFPGTLPAPVPFQDLWNMTWTS